ncbi:Uncharacterised protein [Klebsiella pneumoniae]|uniref:Uncharacterized protein n=1 Tax=Klebsiella pneumoniae TaxID=573 RepID=A0A378H133_KLEPN|nr:Uncharacterised protein [Klebsiella pneumoniae]
MQNCVVGDDAQFYLYFAHVAYFGRPGALSCCAWRRRAVATLRASIADATPLAAWLQERHRYSRCWAQFGGGAVPATALQQTSESCKRSSHYRVSVADLRQLVGGKAGGIHHRGLIETAGQ